MNAQFLKNANELDEVIKESFDLLGQVLDESNSFGLESDYRLAFIYRHARHIYHLGHDVIFLLKSGRLDSCPVIVRAMLESLFKLIAAVKQSETAVQILIAEVESDIERMKLLNPITCAPGIKMGGEFAAKLRKEYNVTSKKKWTVFECAAASELVDKYQGDYFVFSGRSHATTGGIITQERRAGAGHALQTLLFIVTYASGGFAQVVLTKTPQQHVDESARLMMKFATLVDSGIFNELERDLDEIEN
jgi:hypothetical protein